MAWAPIWGFRVWITILLKTENRAGSYFTSIWLVMVRCVFNPAETVISLLLLRVPPISQLYLERFRRGNSINAHIGKCLSEWHECWSSVVPARFVDD